MECLRYQCFYLCLQAIDVNPSFFPSNVIKWSSNKQKICHPIVVHINWAELRAKIRSNLCSRKRQAALSLEFSIYSFVELVSFAAIFRTKHHISTYKWIISLLFILLQSSLGTDPVTSLAVTKSLFNNLTEGKEYHSGRPLSPGPMRTEHIVHPT